LDKDKLHHSNRRAAWSGGVFRNDPKEVAAWWKGILKNGMGQHFDSVFHAVLDHSKGKN
jgi:hypothetical protein